MSLLRIAVIAVAVAMCAATSARAADVARTGLGDVTSLRQDSPLVRCTSIADSSLVCHDIPRTSAERPQPFATQTSDRTPWLLTIAFALPLALVAAHHHRGRERLDSSTPES